MVGEGGIRGGEGGGEEGGGGGGGGRGGRGRKGGGGGGGYLYSHEYLDEGIKVYCLPDKIWVGEENLRLWRNFSADFWHLV